MSPTRIESLRSHDAATTSLFLIESPSVYFPSVKALIEALRCNTRLENIHFGVDIFEQMSKNDIKAILERFGTIESLKEVHYLSGSVEISSLKSVFDNVYLPSVKALTEALSCNKTLESIHFGVDFFEQMSKNDVKAILERVGKIQSLKEIHFLSGSVEIKSLKILLDNSSKLRVFHLGNVSLEGNATEFDDLVQALPRSLEELSLVGTRFLYNDVQFNGVLKAIPSLKQLSVLKLAPYYDGKDPESRRIALSSSLLVKVLEMPTFRDLHLSQLLLGQSHVGVISWALDRGNLKVLELPDTGFNDIAAGRLAASLEKSTLERLDLSNNNDLTGEGCTLIAESLLKNKTIKVLVLAGCKHIGAQGLAALANVAETNSGLQHVEAPPLSDAVPSGKAPTASEESKYNNFRATAA